MATRSRAARTTVVLLVGALAGCGGGSSGGGPTTAFNATPAPVQQLGSGTVLSVVSGDDDTPVSGASVQIGSASYRTDLSGRVTLTAPAAVGGGASPQGATVIIEAPGFLTRRTLLRTVSDTEFALWPAAIPAKKLDERLTSMLVYTSAAHCCPDEGGYTGRASLTRMRAPRVASVGIPDAYGDTVVLQWVLEALEMASDASGGRVSFVYSGTALGDVQIKESFTGMTPQGVPAAGYFMAQLEGGYIRGGEITLSVAEWASDPPATWPWTYRTKVYASYLRLIRQIVAHELGHCLGLQHHYEPLGMMTSFRGQGSYDHFLDATERFTPPEITLLNLAYRRPPGNVYPDSDDRVVLSSTSRRYLACVLRPLRDRGRLE